MRLVQTISKLDQLKCGASFAVNASGTSPSFGRRSRSASIAAFTLIEVILAIFIALAILVVLLYFYQQATNLRTQALQQTDSIAAARLIMDRITGELRTMQADSSFGRGFVGSSNSIQFVRTDVPSFASWTGGTLGRSAAPVTDRKVIRYRLESAEDGTNVAGLVRFEEPLLPQMQLTNEDDYLDFLVDTNEAPVDAPSVLSEIRFLKFRYWSGTNWLDSWSGSSPPEAIEVSLGPEAITNLTDQVESVEPTASAPSTPSTPGTESAEFAADIFRRVIYLGASTVVQSAGASANAEPADASSSESGSASEEGGP